MFESIGYKVEDIIFDGETEEEITLRLTEIVSRCENVLIVLLISRDNVDDGWKCNNKQQYPDYLDPSRCIKKICSLTNKV